jgi:hypothetical protein
MVMLLVVKGGNKGGEQAERRASREKGKEERRACRMKGKQERRACRMKGK